MKNLIVLLAFLPLKILACSAFFCDGPTKYFAKNFDWSSGQGYVIKNLSGQKKFAYGLRGSNQANWVSKYGSVTFNQIGKEFPYGGINEKGLVVEQLWMSESIYSDYNTHTISELEWIQYQLDLYATIDEIIINLDQLTIKPIATIHYFIADRNGNSAVIDFVNGKAVVNKKQEKNQVITNETFLNSEKYFELHKTKVNKDSRTNYARFCQIKNSLAGIAIENPQQAFEILKNSAETKEHYKTYWTVLYDLSNLKIYFKSFDNTAIKEVNLSQVDFSPNATITASAINQDYFRLEEYSAEMNSALFTAAMKMMGVQLDETLGSTHQMSPIQPRIDKVYQENYFDLKISFLSKSPRGNIYYTIINGEENFSTRQGIRSGRFQVEESVSAKMIYGMRKGAFAVACFQDTDLDNSMDTKLFGIPKNYGFSRNNRGFFGTPPKYKDAVINFKKDTAIIIKIK